jgi:hypothetical protein
LNQLIRETTIADLPSFFAVVREASLFLGAIHPLWRGHADIDWALKAEVFRQPPHGTHYPEVTLIRTFMGQAESRSDRCPPSNDLLGWLILARHYGLPTRILDWSMSPMVALFFAVESTELQNDGVLWAINPGHMNHYMAGDNRYMLPDDDPVQIIVKHAYETDPERHKKALDAGLAGKAVAVGTREIDPRVMVQQGAFTIHADGQDLTETRALLDAQRPWLIGFRIMGTAKSDLLTALNDLGVFRCTLFPDLGSLAADLKQRSWATT